MNDPTPAELPLPPGNEERVHGALILAFCLILFFLGLGDRDLWDQDEGMHSASAKVMVESGDWVTPRFNGENFYDKPVLFTWAVAGSLSTLGYTNLAARLPGAIFGLLGVLITWRFGRRLFGARAGLLAAFVLASSVMWVILARSVMHDIALAVCTTLALHFFWIAYKEDARRLAPLLGFWISTAAAILAKGPVGFLPPVVGLLFLLAMRRFDLLWKMRPLLGGLCLLAVAGPWYTLMALRNPDYIQLFVIDKVLGSLASEDGARRAQPFYYYLLVFPAIFLPWTALVPTSFAWAWRTRNPEKLFALIWFGATFAIFSLASAKLSTYILPLFPAAALLIGEAGSALWEEREGAPWRGLRISTWIFAALMLVLVGGATLFLPDWIEDDHGLMPGTASGLIFLLAAGATASAWLLRHGRVLASFVAMSVGMASMLLVTDNLLAPDLDPYKSSRDVGRVMVELQPGQPVPVYNSLEGMFDSALFYHDLGGYDVDTRELFEHLDRAKPVLIVMERSRLSRLEGKEHRFHVVWENEGRLIISNRPAAHWGNPR